MPMEQSLTPRDIAFLRSLSAREYQDFISSVRVKSPSAAAEIARQVEGFDFRTEDKLVVANFFGVSIETIEHWQIKGMPYVAGGKGGRNGYDLASIAQWVTRQRSGTPSEDDAKANEEAKFRAEKARMVELQRRKFEGQLVDKAAYQQQMSSVLEELRKGLDLLVRQYGDEWLTDFERVLASVESKLIQSDK